MAQLVQQAIAHDPNALKMLKELAKQNDSEAMLHLGYLYDNGLAGLEQDPEIAVKYFQKAAEGGVALGWYNLGMMFMQGRPPFLVRNPAKAREFFLKIVSDRHLGGLACVQLGRIHESEKDYQAAYIWYSQATRKGEKWLAPTRLGLYHYKGLGTVKAPKKAVQWLKEASEHWNREAQYLLGVLYSDTNATCHNPILAAQWLEIASSGGNPEYVKWYKAYVANMDEKERRVAHQKASIWINGHSYPTNIPNYDVTINVVPMHK
ncbi:hypothetical protein SAMN02746041_03284 [Desulfacinum hydrothermale DSM 13146]|uniref:TPR repeat n=1 Tax=Desulfacinum hydrothermale DSM 13146 TaxID=1121390 RepID=A0A1W1XX94_9BACT|nr:tetratricopeptide repeat protein [Desulfacinum hydrothermale]SMC28589.1 hypothetical protein SAMN02746041_03284 [Desulfacinum hydrothermale DSM 13146]